MNLKKLDQKLDGTIAEEKVVIEKAGEVILTKVKQGGDLFFLTKENISNGLVLSALQKVPSSLEGSPRVLIITAENDKARSMFELCLQLTRRCEIDVEHAHDKGNQIEQRNNIFEGAEIVIGNIRRVYDLYLQNGINMNMLQLLIIDDASKMLRDSQMGQFKRLMESLPKCQRIIISSENNAKVEALANDLLIYPEEIISDEF